MCSNAFARVEVALSLGVSAAGWYFVRDIGELVWLRTLSASNCSTAASSDRYFEILDETRWLETNKACQLTVDREGGVPFRFMLFEDFSFGMITNDLWVDETTQVEALGSELSHRASRRWYQGFADLENAVEQVMRFVALSILTSGLQCQDIHMEYGSHREWFP